MCLILLKEGSWKSESNKKKRNDMTTSHFKKIYVQDSPVHACIMSH
jgi:hypothetical protein